LKIKVTDLLSKKIKEENDIREITETTEKLIKEN
jgi:hypothetical protein